MNQKILYGVIACLSLACCFFFYSYMRIKAENIDAMLTDELPEETPYSVSEEIIEKEVKEEYVTFYICGEVHKPDIYTLPKGSRINDAIITAGGSTEEASFEMMESIAKEITDGQKIYVPNMADDIDKINYMNNNNSNGLKTETTKNPNAVVNINTAGIEELSTIPGIGEATAKLIVDYRLENGRYIYIEEIKNVSGIGDKTFERIKGNITVGSGGSTD